MQQEVAQAVRTDLKLDTLRVDAVLWREHDACIVDEHMEMGLGCQKRVDGWFDGAEIGQIELQEVQVTFALGGRFVDALNGAGSLGL